MNTDTINFLEALLSNADTPDNGQINLSGKTVYDFTPAFTDAVDKFVSAFRAHLEQTGFPVGKLLNAERSFGGNVYWSLSGAGVGFFDDRDEAIAGLHERLKTWAGPHRFEDLANNLDVGEDGKIDLAFIPSAIEEYREKYFGVPKVETTPPEQETKPLAHTPGKWTIEGEGILHNAGGGLVGTTRIGTRGYGEIELVDSTNEPEGNKYLIAAAPEMLQALEDAAKILALAHRYFPKSIKNRDTFGLCNIEANSVNKAIAKAKGVQ
jgi:hypothetical protein